MYLTRVKNGNPDNKQKIVVAAAEKDYELYYRQTAELLLNKKNCAVISYIELANVSRSSSLEETLDQGFVLMVFIVTNRLTENAAEAAEMLEKANRHQLPVLPILWENLHDFLLYNTLFENRQFLNPQSADSTEIPFDKKLGDYLDSIMSDDDTLHRIDEELSERVFLSYRKANRAYVNKLFRAIHNDPVLMDVGIWYDEYIAGGDDFEADIFSAIDRSSVFLLCITDKLLCEDNYVKDHEYPYAVKKNLPVIAAAMEDCDLCEVQKQFEGLNNIIPFSDKERLTEELKKHITPNQSKTAEHCYYTGLAYLYMRYVEYDPQFAFVAIMQAAKMGLPEAAMRLSVMFREGQGIERDHEKSMDMQMVAVELLEKKLSDPSQNTDSTIDRYLNLYLETTLTLGNELLMNGHYSRALTYFKKFTELFPTPESDEEQKVYSAGLMGMAQAEMNLGQYQASIDHLGKVIDIRDRLYENADKGSDDFIIYRRALAAAYLQLGDVMRKVIPLAQADQNEQKFYEFFRYANGAYQKCLELRRQAYLDLKKGDVFEFEARRDLAVILVKYAELLLTYCSQEPETIQLIQRYYLESLQLREDLYTELKRADDLRDVGVCCRYLGEFELAQKNVDAALRYFKRSEETLQEVTDITGSYNDMYKLALAYRAELSCLKAQVESLDDSEYFMNCTKQIMCVQDYIESLKKLKNALDANKNATTDDEKEILQDVCFMLVDALTELIMLSSLIGNTVAEERAEKENTELLFELSEMIDPEDTAGYQRFGNALYNRATAKPDCIDRNYLEGSLQIYTGLTLRYPDNSAIAEMYNHIKSLLNDLP
ncbi:MAG: toll/interleukin-1 receptor domain-containing protein [Ruminococcus sp.]|nr:toll/interleukin-1 receptor domain-containing protein [Ruminococcus sp.]